MRELLKKIKPLRRLVINLRAVFKKKPKVEPIIQRETYEQLAQKLILKDKQNIAENPDLKELHSKLNRLNLEQIKEWDSFVYCGGYFYQGYGKIGITGIKPTEPRMENYDIKSYYSKEKSVLDIGANAGFLASYLSEYVKEIDAIELNPYLIKMGNETTNFLNISNVNFIEGNYIDYSFDRKYDIIFSLSNHFTIDGNLNIGFDQYIKKAFDLLNEDGVLFFESHNVWGDDSDMDEKFKIASKYFDLEKHKMVKCFYAQDIDKLFAVFKRRKEAGEPQEINFKLEEAIKSYNF